MGLRATSPRCSDRDAPTDDTLAMPAFRALGAPASRRLSPDGSRTVLPDKPNSVRSDSSLWPRSDRKSLTGIWEGSGFDRTPDLEHEIRGARNEFSAAAGRGV